MYEHGFRIFEVLDIWGREVGGELSELGRRERKGRRIVIRGADWGQTADVHVPVPPFISCAFVVPQLSASISSSIR